MLFRNEIMGLNLRKSKSVWSNETDLGLPLSQPLSMEEMMSSTGCREGTAWNTAHAGGLMATVFLKFHRSAGDWTRAASRHSLIALSDQN